MPPVTPTFSDNKLTGTLPPELGAAWPAMAELSLNSNAFTGPLPKEWSKMGRLKLLYLLWVVSAGVVWGFPGGWAAPHRDTLLVQMRHRPTLNACMDRIG